MKSKENLIVFLIALMLTGISHSAFASTEVTSISTIIPLDQDRIDQSDRKGQAVEVCALQLSGTITSNTYDFKISNKNYNILCSTANYKALQESRVLDLYYSFSLLIIPGLGLDALLFPFHSHT